MCLSGPSRATLKNGQRISCVCARVRACYMYLLMWVCECANVSVWGQRSQSGLSEWPPPCIESKDLAFFLHPSAGLQNAVPSQLSWELVLHTRHSHLQDGHLTDEPLPSPGQVMNGNNSMEAGELAHQVRVLLFQRTTVQFPAPTSGNS